MSESSRGAPAKRRPGGPRGRGGRRTQAERDAIQKAEQERNKERDDLFKKEANQARIAAERAERDRRRREENAARNRGRGGFMGGSSGHEISSGPLSGGSSIAASIGRGQAFPRPWAPSGGRSRAAGKAGDGLFPTASGSGGGGGGGGSSARAPGAPVFDFADGWKGDDAIDGGYISSDPEVEAGEVGARRPVEFINLASDDDDEDGGENKGGVKVVRGAPTRMVRLEHRARAMQVNTEAGEGGAGGGAKIKKEDGEDDVPVDSSKAKSSTTSKARDKSLEITSQRPFQGAWRDPPQPLIKEDPDEPPPRQARGKAKEVPDELDAAPAPKEVKPRIFHNIEEQKEYERELVDASVILKEFGDKVPEEVKSQSRTYLFQFPPVFPGLAPKTGSVIKEDPDAPAPPPPNANAGQSASASNTADKPIKIEDGASAEDLKPKPPTDKPVNLPTLAPGAVGKLRVHKSGKVTMDWGGSPFEVRNGVLPEFLQGLVLVDVPPAGGNTGIGEGNMGTATAFGAPRGKLVVLPDWDGMLGSARE